MKIKRKTKKILQITYNKFPPEIRVVKEGLSLQVAGYQSAVLCPPFGDQPEYEVWNGIEVFRPRVLNKRSVLDKLLLISVFYSSSWYSAIRNVISQWHPDVLHVHDIWLGRTAFSARTTEKIVMDLHENMPAAVVEHLKGNHGLRLLFFSLFRSYRRIFAYERSLLERCDLVFAVVQEARERVLINHPALNSDQVINVENLESKRFVAAPGVGLPALEKIIFPFSTLVVLVPIVVLIH